MVGISLPFWVIGIWNCENIIYRRLGKTFDNNEKQSFMVSIQSNYKKIVRCFLVIVFGISFLGTTNLLLEFFKDKTEISTRGLLENQIPEAIEVYEDVAKEKNRNLLYISGDYDTMYWWMCYYGRDNKIYRLNYDFRTPQEFEEIPDDVEIKYSLKAIRMVEQEDKQSDFAGVLQYHDDDGVMYTADNWNIPHSSKFEVRIFARYNANAVLKLKINLEEASDSLVIDEKQYTADSNGEILVPINLLRGVQKIQMKTESEQKCQILEWKICDTQKASE